MKTTTVRKRHTHNWLRAFAGACVAAATVIGVFVYTTGISDKEDTAEAICATEGDRLACIDAKPATAIPSPEPTSKSKDNIRLTLTPGHVSDASALYIERAGIVPRCPLCVGIDRPALDLDDNEIVLWQALFCTEVSCNPWDEHGNAKVSSAGCVGASQICNMSICGGVTERDRRNPEMSMYLGACYFAELIERYDGDYTLAIAAYKGALVDGVVTHPGQVNSVWDYVRVSGLER